jgi:hypothetical protein
MNSKSINQAMSHYLKEMLALKQRAVPPKIDDYCSVLKDLLWMKYAVSWKNSMLIDGSLLQLEEYFFKPYYDNGYKMVLDMLQKAGIFTGGIKSAKKKKLAEPKKEKIKL